MLFSKKDQLLANFSSINCIKICCLAAMLFCTQNTAIAQDGDDDVPKNVIKLNLGSLFVGHANVAYQRGLGKHFAVQVAGLYGSVNLPLKPLIDFDIPYIKSINYQGWGIVPTVRYYPLNVTSAPQGLYAEAFFQYRQARIKNCVDESIIKDVKQYTVNLDLNYVGVGAGIGYQLMVGSRKNIVLDAMVGLKYSHVSLRTGWEGVVKFDAIPNPAGGYFVSPEAAAKVQDFINRDLVTKINNKEVPLSFLSEVDILRSAFYIGYAF
jgi:hypothetical protein